MSIEMIEESGSRIGRINTKEIYNTHQQIKNLVEEYIRLQEEVNQTTLELTNQWTGKACEEFKNQYKLLISKIDDFGQVLAEVYEKLVQSEAEYEDADFNFHNEVRMAMGGESDGK